jgi:tRNA(fMet)-specific endonuclease VapC
LRYFLDTNIVSHAMRGNPKVIERLKAAERDQLFLSAVTFSEIEYGIARAPKGQRGLSRRSKELRELFDALLTYIEVAAWDRAAAKRYAAIRVEREGAGKGIDQADLMIAAHAASFGATLVTADKALLQRPKARAMPPAVNWLT